MSNIIHNFLLQTCASARILTVTKRLFLQPGNLGTALLSQALLPELPGSEIPVTVPTTGLHPPLSHGYLCVSPVTPLKGCSTECRDGERSFDANVELASHSPPHPSFPILASHCP